MVTSALAVLEEIYNALEAFHRTGREWLIFLNKLPLTPDDRRIIAAVLGRGEVAVTADTDMQPSRWQESGISGVWLGTMLDSAGQPALETVEIGRFPQLAAAQPQDVAGGAAELRRRLNDAAAQQKLSPPQGDILK